MKKLTVGDLLASAGKSTTGKWFFNFILKYAVPFNKPHRLKLLKGETGSTTVLLPYRRSNLNHIKSIHACALATLCEYTTGLTLLSLFSEKEYRIILKNIKMEYHLQALTDVTASFTIKKEMVEQKILLPLKSEPSILYEFEIHVFDKEQKHICTGFIKWQIKSWQNVKLKR
jgi:acyl-coenzyme A thioesterase PaaI-like protein